MPLSRESDSTGLSVPSAAPSRLDLIADLRARIRHIEGRSPLAAPAPAAVPEVKKLSPAAWTLGVPEVDALLGADGLDPGGVHEIRSARLEAGMTAAAATAARRTFALLLSARRLSALDHPGTMLWCLPAADAWESGGAYSRGFAVFGLDPDRVLIATPTRSDDVLWVIEEAVKASCLSLVFGEVGRVDATAARRLSLAAAQTRTPCILVSPIGKMPLSVTASRWSIAPRLSGTDPLDVLAPGPRRFALTLERCRARPLVSTALEFVVEWSDAARSFHMAAAVSDRTPAPVHDGHEIADGERTRRIA